MQKIKKTFYDENKKRNVSYVLSSSLLGNSIASDLMDGFAEITGHYNSRSRDQAWRSVMKFVRYICSIGIDDSAVSRNKCNSQLIFLSMLITKLGIPASETSLPLGV